MFPLFDQNDLLPPSSFSSRILKTISVQLNWIQLRQPDPVKTGHVPVSPSKILANGFRNRTHFRFRTAPSSRTRPWSSRRRRSRLTSRTLQVSSCCCCCCWCYKTYFGGNPRPIINRPPTSNFFTLYPKAASDQIPVTPEPLTKMFCDFWPGFQLVTKSR